jgi:hypothetical protein
LAEEPARINANWSHLWHYQRLGYYHDQLQRYFALFPRQQIAVYTYDEFAADPRHVLQRIFQFLEVDPSFEADVSLRYNISGRPRFSALQKLLLWPNPLKDRLKFLLPAPTRKWLTNKLVALNVQRGEKEPLDPAVRQQLLKAYRPDILKLQSLIEKELSHWLV